MKTERLNDQTEVLCDDWGRQTVDLGCHTISVSGKNLKKKLRLKIRILLANCLCRSHVLCIIAIGVSNKHQSLAKLEAYAIAMKQQRLILC